MSRHSIVATSRIPAPADRVYSIIADYHVGHPSILPRPPFVSLTVLKGGVGAGTEISAQLKLLGKLRTFRAAITEPEPGRVIAETDLDTGGVTTFMVEPGETSGESFVTIETRLAVRNGPAGALEGWLAARILRPVYERELNQLARVAAATP